MVKKAIFMFLLVVMGCASPVFAAKFDYSTANEIFSWEPSSFGYTPGWEFENTSDQTFTIGSADYFPLATIDWGNLPVVNPFFEFNRGDRINGITLAPGETMGTGDTVGVPPYTFPTPTHFSGIPLFEFSGDGVLGKGTAYVTFGFGPNGTDPSLVDHVTIPFTFDIKSPDDIPTTLGVNKFSAVTVTPEPATMALFGLGGAALAARRRKMKKSKK